MSVPVLPENAPFTPAQRAWLNGFFAGVLSLESSSSTEGSETSIAALSQHAQELPQMPTEIVPSAADEDLPWHDPILPISERISLAEGKPIELRLMAAMAQLDCGTCGYLCRTYAQAIVQGEERSLTRCTPGGRDTAKQLKQLMAQAAA